MRINTNVAALNSYNQLKNTQNNLSKSLSRLSSGKRINGAADDAAGLAISEKMNSQTRGLAQAQRNAQDGISMIQTAEGALKESHSILQRMRELSVQSANDTNTSDDRAEIQKEVNQLNEELDRIANTTEFNKKKLLNGDLSEATTTQESVWNTKAGIDSDASGAAAAAATTLDSLYDGNGNPLGIQNGDTLNIEVTVNGTLETASVDVTDIGTQDLSAVTGALSGLSGVNSAAIADGATDYNGDGTNEENGSLVLQGNNGVANSITSVSIKAVDGSGNERTNFNNVMNNLTEIQSAQDTTTDDSATMLIGANEGQTMSISMNNMDKNGLGVGGVDVSTQNKAENAVSTLDRAIAKVSEERSKLGAYQNRLDHTINNLNTSEENLTAAESRISDVDMAKEMMNMSKQQILSQAGTAMMAQANQLPQGVLQLLG